MKVSLITTVYNEGESVKSLLDSVVRQTRTPDEFVIVDGGSTDQTQEIIEDYSEEHDWIWLIVDEGCNIAEGRNTAIENASNEYIIGTDGGCKLDENWVEEMASTFEEGYEALSGLWKPDPDNLFEFVQGEIRGNHVKPENVPDGWAPSSRSVGYTKQVWQDAGKYPEDLYTGEDSEFNTKVRKAGYDWHVVRDAFVYWDMRPTWKDYFKQFYKYGEGEARSREDYPDKIFGVSKTSLRLVTTLITAAGVVGLTVHPAFLLLTVIGLGPQYSSKISSLKSSIAQKGLRTVPYWLLMIPFESVAFASGHLKEKIL